MDSVDLNMEDIFEEQDEDFPSVGPLPDLPEDDEGHRGDQEADDTENNEVLSKLKDLSKGASKKVERKPQPKLDAARLCGERGIPILPKAFQSIKFKGKGHETKDLGVIMRYLEHWAHRLYPKMPFDEVLERIEKLGTKKEVQTCIKRMRMDMPILTSEFVGAEDDDDDAAVTDGADGGDGTQPNIDKDADKVWDEMVRQEEEERSRRATPVKTSHLLNAFAQFDTPTPHVSTDQALSTPITPLNNIQGPAMGLTPEQAERMERNKRLAMEKRNKGKSVFKVPATPSTVTGSPVNHPKTTPSIVNSADSSETALSTTNLTTDSDEMSEIISRQDGVTNERTDVRNTLELNNDSEMSEVFPVVNGSTRLHPSQGHSGDSSSQEMNEVFPPVGDIQRKSDSGASSPSNINITDDI